LAPIIDAHCSIGEGRYARLAPEALLEQMDLAGVDRAVVSPVHEHITVYNREGNDYILDAVRRYPRRFVGFATVNPWYGPRAVEELRRALGEGLRGLALNSALQGYFIHDELVHPVIEVAAAFGVPVYFHTATPIYALPFQLAELALVFPHVHFIMGHLAAADFWTDAVPAAKQCGNIYVETSIRSGIATIRQAVRELGIRRVLFGSDAPESDVGVELAKIRLVGLAADDEDRVLGGNMLQLLGEAGGAGQW
jgi:predicted TIM-barrel fold metal-dependent hydrolase